MLYIIVFIFGSILGSAIGAYIYRRKNLKSFLIGRSKCEICGKQIPFYYNIPILSYIILKGKCKNCKNKIPVYIFMCEIIMAILTTILYINYGFQFKFLLRLLELILLLIISVTDIREKAVYTIDIFALFSTEFFIKIYYGDVMLNSIKMMVLLGMIYFLIYYLSKAMGEADVILGAVSGFFATNFYEVFKIFRNSFMVAAFVVILLVFLKNKGAKEKIAFCPYIAISILMVII
ncbi:A24 family peptidase [Peptoniphilus sp. oral taxon 386]|uniref:prepilin peptidase n=1 Tax=Peptoniphilus sp. oral taxon 386 TaxID=652713 RepID=UPI0001DA9BBA|nr:prepilin peptidase [Peptoniphilus sp. oral taxon 386]EFI42364.1 bacterial peptidase A24, N-terminal domain protein [Peptoniphilus sp. oral taxon 386 str. F0131]